MATSAFNDDWTIIKGKLCRRWDKLKDADLEWVDGQRRELEARIVNRHGLLFWEHNQAMTRRQAAGFEWSCSKTCLSGSSGK